MKVLLVPYINFVDLSLENYRAHSHFLTFAFRFILYCEYILR